jgi:iron complex outermembrane receptor protein
MFHPTIKRKSSLLAVSIAAALSPGMVSNAVAQDSPGLEEITITGSRIVRRDFEANSPIQTIDAESFENLSALGVENALNQLPQFVPAATQFTQIQDGELINTGSTLTAGAATISLRGFGPNRNLVLIDGRRAMPVNASMAVDANSIPSSAIQRVEVITGGASSVYGADAVAGVVNFILKDDYEGAEIDIQYGAMADGGHAGEGRLSALFGANTADGRGNVMLGVEYFDRNSVDRKYVDFYYDSLLDPTVNGTQSFNSDTYYQIDGGNPPSGAAIDSIFTQAPGQVFRGSNGSISGRVAFNDDLSLYSGNAVFGGASPGGPGGVAGNYRYNGPTFIDGTPFRKLDPDGRWEENIIGHKATVPLERFSTFAKAHYDLTDNVTAFAQINVSESNLRQLWQWSPAAGGWGQNIPHGDGLYEPSLDADGISTLPAFQAGGPIGLACAPTGGCSKSEAFPVSPELAILLDSRPNPEADWNLNFFFDYPLWGLSDPRLIDTETKTNQYNFGLEGRIEAIDGTWDITASHGTSTTILNLKGYAGLQRHRTLITSPNYGKGFFREANPFSATNFSGGVARCTSGIPVFRDHSDVSQDCLDAFLVDLQNNAEMRQNFVQANIQGRVMDLPAGEARFAAGYEWRRNNYFYIFDTLTTQGSYLDLSMGTFPADNVEGRFGVEEVYGELFVPVLSGMSGIEHLNLELGYRYSDYDLQGGVDTYKVLADWGITEELRFRGGYQLATRAPNIAELYQAQSQSWSVNVGDPCGLNSLVPYGANSAVNSNAAKVQGLCQQFMGQVGASTFYDPAQPQPAAASSLWFVNAVGNPNVQPEEATTKTAGLVWQPSSDNAWLDGLTATVDWFSIEIEDMIALEGGPNVYAECFNSASNPSFDIKYEPCQRIRRNPESGGLQPTSVTYQNTGFANIEGLDVALNWQSDLSDIGINGIPGYFGVNFMWNSLLTLDTQATPTSPVIDWTGSLGPDPGTSLNNGAYDYRLFTTFNYGFDNWNFTLRWRHLPEADPVQRPIAGDNPIPFLGAEESYNVFDLAGNWNISDRYVVRFGIDNLLDEDPVITGAQTNLNGNIPTTGMGTTEAGFYDILGRRWFLGMKATF